MKGNVSFDRIEIREYEQILGDNPSVTSGPPLSLGWNYYPKHHVFDVEVYEENKKIYPGRTRSEMQLSRRLRERILKRNWQVPREEMIAMSMEVKRIQKQRIASIKNNVAFEITLDMLNNTKRMVAKHLLPLYSSSDERLMEKRIKSAILNTSKLIEEPKKANFTRQRSFDQEFKTIWNCKTNAAA